MLASGIDIALDLNTDIDRLSDFRLIYFAKAHRWALGNDTEWGQYIDIDRALDRTSPSAFDLEDSGTEGKLRLVRHRHLDNLSEILYKNTDL